MVEYSISEDVGVLTFNNKDAKVNTLTSAVMEMFFDHLQKINNDKSIKCLVITSDKPGVFIAGADINEIKDIRLSDKAELLLHQGHKILNFLASLTIPTIANIEGVCLGGGLELALACDFRISSLADSTKIGLPEVNLGIIPGFGGTQRLSRLIGLIDSLGLILTGKPVSSKKALRLGLVDGCYPEGFKLEFQNKFVSSVLNSKDRKKIVLKRKLSFGKKFMQSNIFGRAFVLSSSRKKVLSKTKGNYPAQEKALLAVVKGFAMPLNKALGFEIKNFIQCLKTPVCESLINLFFLHEAQKKFRLNGVDAKPVKQASVIGSGLMGSGISWSLIHSNIAVVLKDLTSKDLLKGLAQIQSIYSQLKKIRKINSRQVSLELHRLSLFSDDSYLNQVDFIIEAIPEDKSLKANLYKDLESKVDKSTIIASNTSSIDIDALSKSFKVPERFIGMHFFSPVNRMPLVEIIPSKLTSKETISTTVEMVKKMKKVPIVVNNCPGFLVNRIFLPYVNEAIFCLLDGASISQIDRVFEKFGMPMGPLALADNVGLDVGIKVLCVLEEAYSDRMYVSDFAKNVLYDKTLLGKKSKKGFYDYTNKKKVPNSQILEKVNSFRTSKADISDQDILNRCVFVMINEATRCLDENIVENAAVLDLAMIMGTGFPPFTGGLCNYADYIGLDNIVDELDVLNRLYGKRFEPSNYLLDCVKHKKTLRN